MVEKIVLDRVVVCYFGACQKMPQCLVLIEDVFQEPMPQMICQKKSPFFRELRLHVAAPAEDMHAFRHEFCARDTDAAPLTHALLQSVAPWKSAAH